MSNFKVIDGKRYKIANPKIINDSPSVCFLVQGKYYRLSQGAITYDYTKKQYVLKTEINVENGIVGIDDKDKPILGSWSWPEGHLMENTIIANYLGQKFFCLNEELFKNTAWEERLSDGEFYLKSSIPVKDFSKIKAVSSDIKNSYPYNAGGDVLKNALKKYDANDFKDYDKGITQFPQVLGKYTYGFEFETTKGWLPPRIYNKLGLIPLRDGSISGIEYASVPIEGKKGIQTIIDSCKELRKRTTFNKDCSLHIHIGGMPRTETYFIALTKLLCMVQEDMYAMFPFYTRGGYRLKKKDYTAPLPSNELLMKIDNSIDVKDKKAINNNFQHVFDFLSMGHNYRDYDYNLKNVVNHPSDPNGTSKWYIKSRYRWVNMIPLLFGNKKTIEFRIHTPTYDYNKVMYFTIICASIIHYAEKMKDKILSGKDISYSLRDVVYSYLSQFGEKYSTLYEYIYSYMIERTSYYTRKTSQGDFYGDENEIISRFSLYEDEESPYDVISKTRLKKHFNDVDIDFRHVSTPPTYYRSSGRIVQTESIRTGILDAEATFSRERRNRG